MHLIPFSENTLLQELIAFLLIKPKKAAPSDAFQFTMTTDHMKKHSGKTSISISK